MALKKQGALFMKICLRVLILFVIAVCLGWAPGYASSPDEDFFDSFFSEKNVWSKSELARLEELADQGLNPAQALLAELLADGDVLPKDEAKAIYLYKLAASQGNILASYRLYQLFLERSDHLMAKYWFRQSYQNALSILHDYLLFAFQMAVTSSANQSPPPAQNGKNSNTERWLEEAGEMALKIKKAYETIELKWFEGWFKGSDDFMSSKFKEMGQLAQAIGPVKLFDLTDKNIRKALKQEAELGHADSQFYLALVFLKGIGVLPSQKKAKYWFQQAAEQGNDKAQTALGEILFEGNGASSSLAATFQWLRKILFKEAGVAPEWKKAEYWLRKAEGRGNDAAQTALDEILFEGNGASSSLAATFQRLRKILFKEVDASPDWKKAEYWFRQAAEQGNDKAQFALGEILFEGNGGIPQDKKEAIYWFQKAAEQGNDIAQTVLAVILFEGDDGAPQDKKKAIYWFRKAAEQGNDMAQTVLAEILFEGDDGAPQDKKKAIYWLKQAAKQGNDKAQSTLAVILFEGDGAPQDKEKAIYWFRKAAEQGNDNSQTVLAVILFEGDGAPQDKKEAIYWFWQAAERGRNPMAQYELAKILFEGNGVPLSGAKPLHWLRKILFKKLSAFPVRKTETEAVYWLKQAAEQGNDKAQADLAEILFEGDGAPQDKKEAVYWFRKAAEQGNDKAQADLAVILFVGAGVPQDKKEAVYWFRNAAKQGNDKAQTALGEILFNGSGVSQDKKEAVYWLDLAVKARNKRAMRQLANILIKGDGVPQDEKRASFLFGEIKKADRRAREEDRNVKAVRKKYSRQKEKGRDSACRRAVKGI